jgi:hypothetical protein
MGKILRLFQSGRNAWREGSRNCLCLQLGGFSHNVNGKSTKRQVHFNSNIMDFSSKPCTRPLIEGAIAPLRPPFACVA